MNQKEFKEWESEFVKTIMSGDVWNETLCVEFNVDQGLKFRYKNARGTIEADQHLGSPCVRIMPDYSQDPQFVRLSEPNRHSIASAIKASWEEFIR